MNTHLYVKSLSHHQHRHRVGQDYAYQRQQPYAVFAQMRPWRSALMVSLLCLLGILLTAIGPVHRAYAAPQPSPIAQEAQPDTALSTDEPTGDVPYFPGRLLLGLEPGVTQQEIEGHLLPAGWILEDFWPALNLAAVRMQSNELSTTASVAAATATAQSDLAASPLLRHASLDAQVQIAQAPNDPDYPQQWSFQATRASDAWQISRGHSDIAIAIIDTGMALEHEDLRNAAQWANQAEANGIQGYDDDTNGLVDDVYGWDWVDHDNTPDDGNGHGTHVAGIIAAETNNDLGIAGHAGKITISPLRVLDERGTGYVSDLVRGINYAIEQDIEIINLSLTISIDSSALHDAILAATDSGILVLAAAGNSAGTTAWPAVYPEVVGVAATNDLGQRASFSNYGPGVELAAPGSSIYSTFRPNAYRTQSGTSMATPHVAALAGLLWSLRPDLDADGILELMQSTARDLNVDTYPGFDEYLGAGQIDFYAAMHAATEGIAIQPVDDIPDLVLADSEVQLDVALSTQPVETGTAANQSSGNPLPVRGANVTQTLLDANGAVVYTDSAASNAGGIASLTSRTPITAGAYTLSTTVGAAALHFPLTVRETTVSPLLSFTATETLAGGSPLSFHIRLHDPENVVTDETLPVHLSTNLGRIILAGGDEVSSTTIQVGSTGYTGTLKPGTMAATGTFTARVGLSQTEQQFTVLPGQAAQLIAPETDQSMLNVASDQLRLTFTVLDSYDNPVADGTTVELMSSTGSLSPPAPKTVNGQAVTVLTLSKPTYNFTIEAHVLDTGLTSTTRIVLMHRNLLPQLHLSPPQTD